jgi:hypothetical protein
MKFGRGAAQQSKPVALPEPGDTATLSTPGRERITARVLESTPDALLVAIMVATDPLTRTQLDTIELEFVGPQGRVRLTGTTTIADPSERDVLRIAEPRSVEVLQEREYVRLRAARPVIVYVGADRMQVESFTVDISGGGMLLAGPDTLRPGDDFQFLLTLAQGEMPVSGTGRVVRIDNTGRRACEFASISESDRRRVVHFIFECQREERARGLQTEQRHGS